MRANPLRFAPLVTFLIGLAISFMPTVKGVAPVAALPVAAWALVQAVLFARMKTRFGYFVAVCSVLFAIGIPNLVGPYLYVRYLKSA